MVANVVRRRSAFTLIELLIVVGIIAILSGIAVVNFLEAQTRSKVSRARTDMRTLASCVEMYAVDRNSYPDTFGQTKMTTPVAYLTSLPKDVFAAHDGSPYFAYMNAVQESDPIELQNWSVGSYTSTQQAALASHAWMIWSNGPDLKDTALDETQRSFNDVVGAPGADYGLFYDATNGTVSRGDIIRSPKFQK